MNNKSTEQQEDNRFINNIKISESWYGAEVNVKFKIFDEDEANLVNELEKLLAKYSKAFLEDITEQRTSSFTDSQIEYLQSVKPNFTVREDQLMKFPD